MTRAELCIMTTMKFYIITFNSHFLSSPFPLWCPFFFFVLIFFRLSSFSLFHISFFFCAFHYHYSSFAILFQFCVLLAGPSLVSHSALRGFPSCGAATSSLDSSRTGRPILKSQHIFTATRFVQYTYGLHFWITHNNSCMHDCMICKVPYWPGFLLQIFRVVRIHNIQIMSTQP